MDVNILEEKPTIMPISCQIQAISDSPFDLKHEEIDHDSENLTKCMFHSLTYDELRNVYTNTPTKEIPMDGMGGVHMLKRSAKDFAIEASSVVLPCNNNNEEFNVDSKMQTMTQLLENDSRKWKREDGEESEQNRRFPWKRMAYVVVLLVLGITCALLALMKIVGGADWMNTATFSVIIMGTVMLLPPGLYYGRILLCICCRCKGYNLWDVPAGPFG